MHGQKLSSFELHFLQKHNKDLNFIHGLHRPPDLRPSGGSLCSKLAWQSSSSLYYQPTGTGSSILQSLPYDNFFPTLTRQHQSPPPPPLYLSSPSPRMKRVRRRVKRKEVEKETLNWGCLVCSPPLRQSLFCHLNL